MSTLVTVLRAASLLAFAAPMVLAITGSGRERKFRARERSSNRAPVLANFAAFGLFFPSLIIFHGDLEGDKALLLALSGSALAVAGAAVVLRSRIELGSAWSFVPMTDEGAGLVTTGPYRRVRHPIYLGLSMLAMGEMLTFNSWPAFVILLFGIVPTFVWRAYTEEALLGRTFGERYASYREHTNMIIPHLL